MVFSVVTIGVVGVRGVECELRVGNVEWGELGGLLKLEACRGLLVLLLW